MGQIETHSHEALVKRQLSPSVSHRQALPVVFFNHPNCVFSLTKASASHKTGWPNYSLTKRCYLSPCYFTFWLNIPSFSDSQLNEIKFHPESLNGGRFQMKIHSARLQFPYSQRSWLKAVFDELFTSLELFVQFSIWKPDSWNRVAVAQASVINAHSNLAEEVFGSVQLAHIILTLSI